MLNVKELKIYLRIKNNNIIFIIVRPLPLRLKNKNIQTRLKSKEPIFLKVVIDNYEPQLLKATQLLQQIITTKRH